MMNIYLKGLYHSFIEYAIGKEQVLQFFNGELFNDSIRRFRELNTEYQELIKKELYTKLASNIPSFVLAAADFVYFYALSYEDSMISIVSMVRRGSVIVSFLFGAMVFREKNLKSKAIDLILVLIGMIFLYLGTK